MLITIISLGILIFIHELGHFLAALWMKVKVETFSLGFGPKLLKFTRNGITYAISCIPLGGYVKMTGEFPEENQAPDPDGFTSKKWWQRIIIAAAGPLFNLFFASILIFASFLIGSTYSDLSPVIMSAELPYSEYFTQDDKILSINNQPVKTFSDIYRKSKENEHNIFAIQRDTLIITESIFIDNRTDFFNALTPKTSNLVGEVFVGLPAWQAGLRTGDRILSVNGIPTHNWNDIYTTISQSTEPNVTLTIERDNEILDLTMTPEINPLSETNQKIIGISRHLDVTIKESYNLWESAKLSTITTASMVYMNYHSLYLLFKNPSKFKNSVGGPVMMYYMTSETTRKGPSETLLFLGIISIMLMIMNLLPIPVLDGGHIMFCLYEGIAKKPLPLKVQFLLQQLGFFLLVSLMIFAFYSDIHRLILKS